MLKCPRCLESISPDDTVTVAADEVQHLDCRRRRDLSPDERVLLFQYCWDHTVAKCSRCEQEFRRQELGADLLGHSAHQCPRCRTDLTEAVRGHLYRCVMLPEELRTRTREAREAASSVIKQTQQLSDRADVLLHEREAMLDVHRALMQQARAALAALREAMQRHHRPA